MRARDERRQGVCDSESPCGDSEFSSGERDGSRILRRLIKRSQGALYVARHDVEREERVGLTSLVHDVQRRLGVQDLGGERDSVLNTVVLVVVSSEKHHEGKWPGHLQGLSHSCCCCCCCHHLQLFVCLSRPTNTCCQKASSSSDASLTSKRCSGEADQEHASIFSVLLFIERRVAFARSNRGIFQFQQRVVKKKRSREELMAKPKD